MAVTTEEHWISTSRGRLFARSWRPPGRSADTGPTVVLIHDSLGCVELWREFPEKLAGAVGLRVVAYDRLGFGRSDAHPGDLEHGFMQDETAAALLPLCGQLGIGSMVPFGHSVGGAMAIGAAAQIPARCSAVITVAAQAFVEDRTLAGIREAKLAFQDSVQVKRLAKYHGAKTQWVLDAWIRTWLAPGFAVWTLDEDLAQVRCPVLAIPGDRDEYGSARHPERIAMRVPGPSRMALLEGCGHVPHREKPGEMLREATAFLTPFTSATEEAP